MTDIQKLICAMQKKMKEIKEKYSYSDSEFTAYLQGQRDMFFDLAEIFNSIKCPNCKTETKGNDTNEQT